MMYSNIGLTCRETLPLIKVTISVFITVSQREDSSQEGRKVQELRYNHLHKVPGTAGTYPMS